MSDIEMFAFTTFEPKIVQRLKNEAVLTYGQKAVKVIALWDTGASVTCIAKGIATALGLTMIGKRKIHTPSGESIVKTYLLNVILPNNVRVENIEVCESEIGNQGIGMLVGMDIISLGDFAVSNFKGQTRFSFRIPSVAVTDYVMEVNSLKEGIGE